MASIALIDAARLQEFNLESKRYHGPGYANDIGEAGELRKTSPQPQPAQVSKYWGMLMSLNHNEGELWRLLKFENLMAMATWWQSWKLYYNIFTVIANVS